MKSIVFCAVSAGANVPPPNTPRTELLHPPPDLDVTVESPKSCEVPRVEMVIYSMVLTVAFGETEAEFPIQKIPRTDDAQDSAPVFLVAKSPKSCAVPLPAMVTYSITFIPPFELLIGDPPPNIPRVDEEHPA